MGTKPLFFVVTIGLIALLIGGCIAPPPQAPPVPTAPPQAPAAPTTPPQPKLATSIRVDALSEDAGKIFDRIVVQPFAKEKGVEIKTVQGTYGKQEEWLAAVKAAPGDYCLALFVSDLGLYTGAVQGLIQPLRLENVPNYSNLEEMWQKRPIVPGDTKPYVGTVSMGMFTFVYAKDKFSTPPDSYAPLFDPKNAGRIALRDYGLYRVFETAAYLGLNPNTMTDQDVDKVFAKMAEQQKLARAYWQTSSQLDTLLANREVWLADYWFDTITRPGADGTTRVSKLNIGWWFPKEGGPMWMGGLTIAAGCNDPQRYTAEQLINYMLRPDVYQQYAAAQGYTPVLKTSLIDTKMMFADYPERGVYQEALIKTGVMLDLGKVMANQEKWNERYEQMKLSK